MSTQPPSPQNKLSAYFAKASLNKIRNKLSATQQTSLDTLISQINEEGKVNFNTLRDTLSPLSSSTNSANTLLKRFLDRLNQTAAESSMVFKIVSTPNKKAGNDRWIWFEGQAEATAPPYTQDLNSIPDNERMQDQRGVPLDRPVLLMTFNEHELQAVLQTFKAKDRAADHRTPSFYRLGIHGGQEVLLIHSRQGRKHAQASASSAISQHHPSAIIATGIAFGIGKHKHQIGDVLVSEFLFDYESARVNPDGSKIYRGARPPASATLLERIRVLDHGKHSSTGWPKIIIGPLACGDKLLDNLPFVQELLQEAPELIGGEMEGAGIEAAIAAPAQAHRIDWIIIKGISDWADGQKNTKNKENDQKTAAQNAALVVKAMLDCGPLYPSFPPPPDLSPAYSRRLSPAQPPQPDLPLAACCPAPPTGQHMRLPDLHEIPAPQVDNTAQGISARLDAPPTLSTPPETDETRPQGTEVLPHLHQWLDDPEAPPLFALLGEYGMGKTITCQLLAKQLDQARQTDPTQPIPLYFDLRHVTGLRERLPTLDETLKECMARGWVDTGHSQGYTLENLHQWIAQGALVIFDGLDEVLVKLTEADGKVFTNNLLKLIADAQARAKVAGITLQPKVLITCRTQYFPTLQAQNSHFTQSDRGEFSAQQYRAMILLPWGQAQIRRYLQQALPNMEAEPLLDMLRTIHNLEELSQRPYTLKLVAEFIPEIEKERASGRPVYGVTLYRKTAEKWLARDSGKHHIRPEHKMRLAAHLAAHLWRTGNTAQSADALNTWFHEWLETQADLHRRYHTLNKEQLEEDLRTATFLARQDDEHGSTFRFAHTSLLEFFLAQYLLDALRETQRSAWVMPVPSHETLNFLGQLLAEAAPNPSAITPSPLLTTLHNWRAPYLAQASELLLAYTLNAHSQAQQAQGWPTPNIRGLDLSGAPLRGWHFSGSPANPLDLSAACFAGADLRECRFEHTLLDQADFSQAQLSHANLLQCTARAARFEAAELTATIFRECRLKNSNWHQAKGYQPQWLLCRPTGSPWAANTPLNLHRPIFAPEHQPGHQKRARETLEWMPPPSRLARRKSACAPGMDALGRYWLAHPQGANIVLFDINSHTHGPILSGHTAPVTACAFAPSLNHPGQQWLASTSEEGTLRLWNTAGHQAGPICTAHQGPIHHCQFAPGPDQAGRLWLATIDDDNQVILWEMQNLPQITPGPVLPLPQNTPAAQLTAFDFTLAPNNSGELWLATGNSQGTLQVWNLLTSQLKFQFTGHTKSITACTFAPGPDPLGRLWLASSSKDGTVRLWDMTDAEAGPILHKEAGTGTIEDCAFSPVTDNSGHLLLASTLGSGKVILSDLSQGTHTQVLRHDRWIGSLTFTPVPDSAGHYWLVAKNLFSSQASLWNITRHEPAPALPQINGDRLIAHPHAPSPPRIATAGGDNTIRLWHSHTGKASQTLEGHACPISSLAFAPQADHHGQWWLASGDVKGGLRLWDAQTGTPGPILKQDCESEAPERRPIFDKIQSCAFAPMPDSTGALWLAAVHNHQISLWDVTQPEQPPRVYPYEQIIICCALLPAPDDSGQIWLAANDTNSDIHLNNISTGEAIGTLPYNPNHPYTYLPYSSQLAWARTHSGQVLLAASTDNTPTGSILHIWNLQTQTHIHSIQTLQDNPFCVTVFAPKHDAAGVLWLVTTGRDGSIQLWNAETGDPGPKLTGHRGAITACTFTLAPNGTDLWLFSISTDGTHRLWELPSGQCLRITACCKTKNSPQAKAVLSHATWNPLTQEIIETAGDAWRHLAWLRPVDGALPERLPLETFGPVPQGTFPDAPKINLPK